MQQHKSETSPIILIGMKSDLPMAISRPAIRKYCKENNLKVYFVSSKLGTNLQTVLKIIVHDATQVFVERTANSPPVPPPLPPPLPKPTSTCVTM
jgi:hypothetical protein